MNDPEKELCKLLKEKWSLKGDLMQRRISFHRGYLEPKLITKPTIICGHVRADQRMLPETALIQLEVECLVSATVYIWSENRSISAQEKAKDLKWSMMEEIQRILAKEALPSGWEWAYVVSHENRDEPALDPPLMGEHLIIYVKCVRL